MMAFLGFDFIDFYLCDYDSFCSTLFPVWGESIYFYHNVILLQLGRRNT